MMADIIKDAQERFKRDKDHWSDIYIKARSDLLFLSDDQFAQWDASAYNARVSTGRPALTIPVLSQFIHQVANDIRMNTPTINVIPSDGASDETTAEVYKGLIRNIEYISNADDAYDTAALNAIKCGIGFIRIDHDYASNEGFEQDLLIKRVTNPLAVYLDSDSTDADGRDAKHATIIDKLSVNEFKKRYKGYDPVSFEGAKDMAKSDEHLYIAEQFYIEESTSEVVLLPDGNIIPFDKGIEFVARRTIKQVRVKRCKLSGADVLEETYFPGSYVPIIPVYGEEAWIEGKRNLLSLIRNSKDAQRLYNFWRSLESELLMKQPRGAWKAAEGQTEDYAADYLNPEKTMVYRYKQVDSEGRPAPAPERIEPPPIPTGIINASRGALEDIKSTMGLYNESIGQKSNAQSGVAIKQRKQEGDVSTFHFGDNLVRSITQVGRVLVGAIPSVYDTARVLRIVGKEDEPKQVGVNGAIAPEQPETVDLTKGRYDVRVTTGAPFTTRRQEAAELFSSIIEKRPELISTMGDLLFKYSDISGADVMEERMKKIIDPKFLEGDDVQEAVDPEKEQMAQIIQQGQQMLADMQAKIDQLEAQAKLQEQEADLEKAQIEIKAQAEALRAQEEIITLKMQLMQEQLQQQQVMQTQVVQPQSEQF